MNTEVADAAESVGPPFHENDDAAGSAEGASLGRHGAPALRSLVDEGRAPMHRDGVAASSLAPDTSHCRDAAAELHARAGGAKTPPPQALAGSGRRTGSSHLLSPQKKSTATQADKEDEDPMEVDEPLATPVISSAAAGAAAGGSSSSESGCGSAPDFEGAHRQGRAAGSAPAASDSTSETVAAGADPLSRRFRGRMSAAECAALAPVPPLPRAAESLTSGAEKERARRVAAWRSAVTAAAAAVSPSACPSAASSSAACPSAASSSAASSAASSSAASSAASSAVSAVVAAASAVVAAARVGEPRRSLRFVAGERVLCRRAARDGPYDPVEAQGAPHAWEAGRVTQVWPANREAQGAPYQVLLVSGAYVYPVDDGDGCIRRPTPDASLRDSAAELPPSPAGGGSAVLTAEEVAALLTSGEGHALLRDAAEASGIPLEAGREPSHLLVGCVVRRRAAVLRAGEPLYSPARIREVLPPAGSGTTPQWRLKLTAFIDDEARDEPPAPLRRLSNAVGEEESRCIPIGAALPLVRALSCGEGAVRLDRLVVTARSGVAAIDKWSELLLEAGVCEDEPSAGETHFVIVGEYSYHAVLYARYAEGRSALLEFLANVTNPALSESDTAVYQRWLVELYDAWPSVRRGMAVAWLRWLLRPDERRAGFPALREFLSYEHGLPHDEHIARDDAGRFSLVRAARDGLIGPVDQLVQGGVLEKLQDPASEACATCSRSVNSCAEWAQMKPCSHWLCGPCLEDWLGAVERSRKGEGVGMEGLGYAAERRVASPGVCPVCRAEVVTRRIGGLNWDVL